MNPQDLWLKQTLSADRRRHQITTAWSPMASRSDRTRRRRRHHTDER